MWGRCILLLGLALLVNSADHGTFKDCSRVDFCTALRPREPSDDYSVDNWVQQDDGTSITGTLNSNSGKPTLSFTLTALKQSTFRLKISEPDSSRYELQDVLDGEPETATLNVSSDENIVTADSPDGTILISLNPFTISFLKNGVTEVVFDGSRLTMAQNQDTAPFSLGVYFPQALQLYGIHEHCTNLALDNTEPGGSDPWRLKNSDLAFYEINSPMALYGAVPVVYGHGPTATAGVFLHNAAEQWIETTTSEGGSAYFMAETGSLDLFIMLGPNPQEVVRQYTALTGVAYLPQLWTLGYHQSRYSYDTQELAKEVVDNFESFKFPLDALWLDIDYTDSYKYFTWNPNTYSDPVALQDHIASLNKKLVTIIDPHIKVEQGYPVYDGALEKDLFVKNADGSVFEGPCWPGTSSYMDFLNPEARDFYANMYSYENFINSTPTIGGYWNDMNEPSVFDNSLEMTLPANSLHMGTVKHREIHNIYGFLHTIATHDGLLKRDNGEKRPFVLTRSHFAGSQRYTAFWTGDNTADWPYLHAEYQECLNANILGIVFCGADVGGFFNNPSNELMERWYQAGAWVPFYRAHSNKDTNRREPYLLPDDSQAIIRDVMQIRYKHIPQLYTVFYEHTRTGDPLIRPLFYQYPNDTNVYKIDNQLLVGSDILTRAVYDYSGQTEVDMYFPGGESEAWVSLYNSDVQAGSGQATVSAPREYSPVYYRKGAVIVRKDTERLNTVDMADDPHTLYYTTNDDGTAHGTVYLDDGVSFKYRDNNDYNYISIDVQGDSVTLSPIDGDGNYDFVVEKIVRRVITEKPLKDKPGTYKETVYTTDANGTSLKDIRFDLKKPVSLKLN